MCLEDATYDIIRYKDSFSLKCYIEELKARLEELINLKLLFEKEDI